jgi:hypothetical protein
MYCSDSTRAFFQSHSLEEDGMRYHRERSLQREKEEQRSHVHERKQQKPAGEDTKAYFAM